MQKTQSLKLFLLCIATIGVFFFAPAYLNAQTGTLKVSGTVTDQKNEPLIGVTISISNTTIGTITDNNGNFY